MEFQAYDIAIVPLIVVLVEVIKRLGAPAKLLPAISLIIAEAAAFIYIAPDDPKQAVLVGLVMGFSAMGLWSGTKNMLDK